VKKSLYNLHSQLENRHWWFRARQKIILALIDKFFLSCKGLKILDAGCGTGEFIPLLEKHGQVYGIDNSQEAIKICKNRGFQAKRGSLLSVPFSDGFFDLTLALDVIEHIDNDLIALRELKRVTKPDGLILITVPAYQFLWSAHDLAHHHKRRYSSKILKNKLKEAGFEILKLSYFNTILSPIIISLRLIKKLIHSKKPDIGTVNPLLNYLLKLLFYIEAPIIKYFNLPFGISLVAVARGE